MGVAATLGGMTAIAALLTGLATARADELADLKANQDLLKQRLDQLALGAPLGVPPPGAPSLAGSFPRSFLIPGTDTSILIGGYVKLDVSDWLSGGSPNGNAATSVTGIPVIAGLALDLHGTGLYAPAFFNAHSRGEGVLQFTAKESRLRVETRTPTAWGEADTVFEFDFYGCQAGGTGCASLNHTTNANLPRLRLAYGTLGGFMGGQNWVPVFDLEANPELFDFGGDAGEFGYARAPQFGYKWALPWGMSFGAYGVYPTTTLLGPWGGTATDAVTGLSGATTPGNGVNPTKSKWPDGNFVLHWAQPWGHLQLSGVVQDLEIEDGHFISKEYIGYGGGFGMNVHPRWFGWAKDNIGAVFYAGNGLDRYASDGTGTEPVTAAGLATNYGAAGMYGSTGCITPIGPTCSAAAASLIRAATIVTWGGEANYQHFWAPGLRSTVSAGVVHWDVPTQLVGGPTPATFNFNKELFSAHANLIWSPVAFVNTGVEYTYGHRDTLYNVKGDENVIDFAFQVKF